jgi:nucleoid-associated protein YgaU
MKKLNRRGVIGFMLTMALGVALGAATLVVGNEIVKGISGKDEKAANSTSKPSSVEVDKAFQEYQSAYKNYQQAVGLGRSDAEVYENKLKEARKNLEWQILKSTPGVSQMDLTGIATGSDSQSSSNTSVSTNVSTTTAVDSSEQVEPVTSSMGNPFGENEIVINPDGNAGSGTSSSAQASENVVSISDSAPSDSPFAVRDTSGQAADATGSSTNNSESSQVSAPDDGVYGMEYYTVKSGDSLSKICQKYYGDSGMWTHILKYQIPTIAATPNLIFPGQLIALPRGFSRDRNESSFVSADSSDGANSNSSNASGDYATAAPGDESWAGRFQKDYLISDYTLTRTDTMTVEDIQSFLDKKGSCLAKPYRGSSPAKMIYDAAKKYGINPQVILTRLQCEQGLISMKTASEHKLDWALGVGAYDSGNWNQKFKGLDKQIEYAAATYRRHYDNAANRIKSGEKVTMTIDGQSVTLKNAASYAFYKYCPHFAGNKLFNSVWNGFKDKF